LCRTYRALVQEIGELAETEGHHPDISFVWGYVPVSLPRLHENDFIILIGLPSEECRYGR